MDQLHRSNYSQDIGNDVTAFESNSIVFSDARRDLDLITSLQTSLDVETVLNKFARHVATFCQVCLIKFRADDDVFTVKHADNGTVIHTFSLEVHNTVYGQLTYVTEKRLTVGVKRQLDMLHELLQYPLHNALQFNRLKRIATRDSITDLGNRLSFDEQLERTVGIASRHYRPVTLLMIDLDNFKPVNDTYGHAEGDKVLCTFSSILRNSIRASDSAYRYGGDEFAVIIEENQDNAPNLIFQRLRNQLAHTPILQRYKVSCSVGSATLIPNESKQSLFARADKALYQAKSFGRNRLHIA